MSLNWSISAVKDYKAVSPSTENGHEGNITHTLIWATMSVGIGDLTEKNLVEFAMRLNTIQGEGHLMSKDGLPYFITMDDLERRIGLHTNVGKEPLTKWWKRLRTPRERERAYQKRRAAEEAASSVEAN